MKILHIVEDFSVKSGGLRTVVKSLDSQLKKIGHSSYILSSDKEKDDQIYLTKSNNKWLYSNKWQHQLHKIVTQNQINLIHIHGVWLYPQLVGAIYASKNNIPFVLSCHGMYQPWLWKKSTYKKKLYLKLLSKRLFSKAAIIHSITKEETNNLKKIFAKNQFIEIPNLISFSNKTTEETKNKKLEKSILYLGRINKTKGIDVLIKAFNEIENKGVTLKIAGNFNDYKVELDDLIDRYKLTNKVIFVGMVKGKQKEDLINNSWVMVSPTFSDVIGMVNLEAGLNKTPMITTNNTGLHKDWSNNGGILINANVKELSEALNESLNWSQKERDRKGVLLFNFVKEFYSWENRLNEWELLYKKAIQDEID